MNFITYVRKGGEAIVSNPQIWLVVLSLLSAAPVFGQGLPGGDPDVPVDGGIVTVVGGAIYYGMRQLRKGTDRSKS
ncbi:MAG: hypothetical protein RLZZ504_1760 [Bacteroidota bacterium]